MAESVSVKAIYLGSDVLDLDLLVRSNLEEVIPLGQGAQTRGVILR